MQYSESLNYSVVVPIYNEEGAVKQLHQDIVKSMNSMNKPYEIIFVNDGSSDKSEDVLATLSPLTTITFRKNFGQTAAMDAGIKQAKGKVLITMDGDGQNPPKDIPKLIDKMKEGNYDIVSGWRHKRKDPISKKIFSRGANILRGMLIKDNIHDSGCSLKAYRSECFEGIDLHGEMHRFIPAILQWKGFTIGEVKVDHKPRIHGETKYNWKRGFKGFVDMVSIWFWRKYATRPLHLFGTLGILLTLSGFALGAYLFIVRLLNISHLADKVWPLLAVFLTLSGLQLFITGLLADIIIKNYYSYSRNKTYTIKEISSK